MRVANRRYRHPSPFSTDLLQLHPASLIAGAGEGNRTLVISLEGFCSTIELHPHHPTLLLLALLDRTGGGGWIRTSVGVSQQIYSLPPLATRAPLPQRTKDFEAKRVACQGDGGSKRTLVRSILGDAQPQISATTAWAHTRSSRPPFPRDGRPRAGKGCSVGRT